jgi:hypothetical protein
MQEILIQEDDCMQELWEIMGYSIVEKDYLRRIGLEGNDANEE